MESQRKNPKSSEWRIIVVDDHAGVRRSLARLISHKSDLEVCGMAEDVGQALSIIEEQRFDLAIVDISLNGADGLELTKIIKSRWPGVAVLIYSSHDELPYVECAFRSGASGYVVKSSGSVEEILTAIRQVLGGGIYMSRQIAEELSACDIDGISTAQAGDSA